MKRFLQFYLYGDVVFNGDMAEGMAFLEKLVPVNREGYGKDAKFLPNDDRDIAFNIIQATQFELTEEDLIGVLKRKLEASEKSYSTANSDRWNAQNELKELKKELETLRSVCPHPVKEEE